MKTKKGLEKKLVLKKRTITDLDNKELHAIYGGATESPCGTRKTICYTDCATDCPTCPTERCM